jgi:hypothetical protein
VAGVDARACFDGRARARRDYLGSGTIGFDDIGNTAIWTCLKREIDAATEHGELRSKVQVGLRFHRRLAVQLRGEKKRRLTLRPAAVR